MGVLNVTPDSFSDGGMYFSGDKAIGRAREMVRCGAGIIDIGGESTRPGAQPVDAEEEIKRVIPVIKELKKNPEIIISCDTSKSVVAEKALEAGADMLNDVNGFSDPAMRKTASNGNALICIMHMRGNPQTMQKNPAYGDVVEEIRGFLYRRADECGSDGIDHGKILLDPGIGFGKKLEHNLEILAMLNEFKGDYPVMVGASRKSFINMISPAPEDKRLGGSIAAVCWAFIKGVDAVRVHDVFETRQALKVCEKIMEKIK